MSILTTVQALLALLPLCSLCASVEQAMLGHLACWSGCGSAVAPAWSQMPAATWPCPIATLAHLHRLTPCTKFAPLPSPSLLQEEPSVLPSRLPNLLINGSSGIAVGIATKIPPHNMAEVVAGLKALIRNPDITVEQLMRYIPAPDFPTGVCLQCPGPVSQLQFPSCPCVSASLAVVLVAAGSFMVMGCAALCAAAGVPPVVYTVPTLGLAGAAGCCAGRQLPRLQTFSGMSWQRRALRNPIPSTCPAPHNMPSCFA